MNTGRETFHKSERLCSRKSITAIFEEGNVIYTPLFKLAWIISPVKLQFPAQAAFSVSKKNFRLAVSRNILKRRMKEAYRKNKHKLYDFLEKEHLQVCIVIIYRKNEIADYHVIEKSLIELLEKAPVKIREEKNKS